MRDGFCEECMLLQNTDRTIKYAIISGSLAWVTCQFRGHDGQLSALSESQEQEHHLFGTSWSRRSSTWTAMKRSNSSLPTTHLTRCSANFQPFRWILAMQRIEPNLHDLPRVINKTPIRTKEMRILLREVQSLLSICLWETPHIVLWVYTLSHPPITCSFGMLFSLSIKVEDLLLWSYITEVMSTLSVGYYADSVLKFRLTFPGNYPESPPSVDFVTDVFHPLISASGSFNLAARFKPWRWVDSNHWSGRILILFNHCLQAEGTSCLWYPPLYQSCIQEACLGRFPGVRMFQQRSFPVCSLNHSEHVFTLTDLLDLLVCKCLLLCCS